MKKVGHLVVLGKCHDLSGEYGLVTWKDWLNTKVII